MPTRSAPAARIPSGFVRFGLLGVAVALFTTVVPEYLTSKLHSANLSSVKVIMSSSKLSFLGQLDATNTVGGSIVSLKVSGPPSTSTANLFTGDTVWIGDGSTGSTYTVSTSTSGGTINKFTTTTALDATDADANDYVIATRSSTLSTQFTTVTAVPNGYFRVLVPAVANSAAASDGIPDSGGFDFGTTPTITCPNDVSSKFDFVAGVATATAITIDTVTYHAYSCYYSGPGGTAEAFNGTSDQILISSVINPAPKATHTIGTADIYSVIVQQVLPGTGGFANDQVIDSTTVKVAPIEAVRVTASVAPTLEFSIAGIPSGTSVCGASTSVATTATNVPLGELPISSFVNAAQTLSVTTNAAGGYVVTARENDQLTRIGTASCDDNGTDGYGAGNQCIPDTTGASETGTGTAWSATSTKGFGYTTAVRGGSGLTVGDLFAYYDAAASSCTGAGTFCARKFADAENNEAAENLVLNTTPADSHQIDVCYRAVVAANQDAGDYENNITYTATATF